MPFEELIYVGDIVGKDFVAPRSLSMYSIWFDNEDELYRKACENEAVVKVSSIGELRKLLQSSNNKIKRHF